MFTRFERKQRKGSVLVEYGLLIAGVVLTCVLAIAVLGHKIFGVLAVMAAIIPGAHSDDNHPLTHVETIPFTTGANGAMTLDSSKLVSPQGTDRTADLLGPGGGESLIIDTAP